MELSDGTKINAEEQAARCAVALYERAGIIPTIATLIGIAPGCAMLAAAFERDSIDTTPIFIALVVAVVGGLFAYHLATPLRVALRLYALRSSSELQSDTVKELAERDAQRSHDAV